MIRKWWLISAIILITACFIVIKYNSAPQVPPTFQLARSKGSEIAGFINNYSHNAIASLNNIYALEEAGRKEEAITLINLELKNLETARSKSLELLDEIKQMALSINGVKSYEAQQTSIRAVSTSIAMVTSLISYNDHLNSLLKEMLNRYETEGVSTDSYKTLSEIVNKDILEINELSRKYQASMREFDNIISK